MGNMLQMPSSNLFVYIIFFFVHFLCNNATGGQFHLYLSHSI